MTYKRIEILATKEDYRKILYLLAEADAEGDFLGGVNIQVTDVEEEE